MANLQYIGARYVPKLFTNPDDNSNNWKSDYPYEALTIVLYNNDSYTSKKTVPPSVGNPADNPDYWVCTGLFNAALLRLDTLVGSAALDTQSTTLTEAINELLKDMPYVTPEMFGASGDGITDETNYLRQAIEYGHDNKIPVKIKKIVVSDQIRFYGDISGGEIILKTGANIIISAPINESVNIHDIKFDVTSFGGVALTVRANHTNITSCSFYGVTTPANVTCIKAHPYVNGSEPFYVNTYKGIWGLHIDKCFFYGVNTCIKLLTPNDNSAWISDAQITNNTGFYHFYSVDIEAENGDSVNNLGGVNLEGNAFSDNYTSDTIRYGLKIKDANGGITSLNNKFFSDGDDTNYYGYFAENALSEKLTQVNSGDDYYNLVHSRIGGLYRNRGTDGKDSTVKGMMQKVFSSTHPNLIGIAKNLLFENTIADVGTVITYANNRITFTHNGSVTNALVTIPIPAELNSDSGKFYYIAVCDFDVSFGTGHRPEIVTVNGTTVTRSEALPWPGTKYSGNICGGCNTISTDFEDKLVMRFLNFPAGTYVIKNLIVFNHYVSDIASFTNDYADLSMFDY